MSFDFMTALFPLCSREEILLPSDLLPNFVSKVNDEKDISAFTIDLKQMQIICLYYNIVENLFSTSETSRCLELSIEKLP